MQRRHQTLIVNSRPATGRLRGIPFASQDAWSIKWPVAAHGFQFALPFTVFHQILQRVSNARLAHQAVLRPADPRNRAQRSDAAS